MDPLTAFSLAAGILQVISFSHELLSKASQIRKEGSTVTAADCNTVADHLREQCQRLQTLKDAAKAAVPTGPLLTETVRLPSSSSPSWARNPIRRVVKSSMQLASQLYLCHGREDPPGLCCLS